MAPVPILVEVVETGFALGSAAVGVERGGTLARVPGPVVEVARMLALGPEGAILPHGLGRAIVEMRMSLALGFAAGVGAAVLPIAGGKHSNSLAFAFC